MAKVGALPALAIVDAFRGKLDYYTWCGLNIVRSWPRAPNRARSYAVQATGNRFAYINQMASTLSEEVVNAYKDLALGTGFSWKDYLNRFYINSSLGFHESQE